MSEPEVKKDDDRHLVKEELSDQELIQAGKMEKLKDRGISMFSLTRRSKLTRFLKWSGIFLI